MFRLRSIKFLTLLSPLFIVGLITAAFLARADDNSVPVQSTPPTAQTKIELTSTNITAERMITPDGSRQVYEVNTTYVFHNPGAECAVRFNLPESPDSMSQLKNGMFAIWEDGQPVEPQGWQTSFEAGGTRTIRIRTYMNPSEIFIDGSLVGADGVTKNITGAQGVFFSMLEGIKLPVGFEAEWVEQVGGCDVEIDFGTKIPKPMVDASPADFSFTGSKFTWHRDAIKPGEEFSAGFMRIADCLYRIEDAKELVRSISDPSYNGYLKDLSSSQRKYFLSVARNGIFAKYGFRFTGPLKGYFEKLDWYKPDPGYSDSRLTSLDKQMVELIGNAEMRYN